MFRKIYLSVAMAALLSYSFNVSAASDADLQDIRAQIEQLRQNYEQRIVQLEQRLKQAELTSQPAASVTTQAQATAQQSAPSPAQSSASAFNPAVSLILTGTYGSLRQDPDVPATGFALSANPGHKQGFNLGESELNIVANIAPEYTGVGTFALTPENEFEVENAFVQSSALGHGFNFKLGRFFSGLGYLNEKHAHTWDFVDQPLAYAALWDNQLSEDGIQLKWLAPTNTFIELGGEIGRGSGFPGTNREKSNGIGATTLFAHVGDDIGVENSWRAGVSLHQTRRVDAISEGVPDLFGNEVTDSFSGDSRTTGVDFVWKYSPNGNFRQRYLQTQGEYFRRKQDGLLTYDTAGANITDSYSDAQSGWYLQSVYQFTPTWRTGLRYDRLDSGIATIGTLNTGNVISDYAFNPTRVSWMVDYSPTEFSRFRLQLARDNSRQDLTDNQIFLQYIMSLGAHGAHQY